MMQVRSEKKPPTLCRFPAQAGSPVRVRPAAGAVVALVALLGSLLAATLGPASGDLLPSPLPVLLMLIRG